MFFAGRRSYVDRDDQEAARVSGFEYEDSTEWGRGMGWPYGSIAMDYLQTGYGLQSRGWKSVYISTAGFCRSSAPIDLTRRLEQANRLALRSVQFFWSPTNPILTSRRLMLLQRMAYLNVAVYPYSSIFLTLYCLVPALSLISGHHSLIPNLDAPFLGFALISICTFGLSGVLESRWSGITMDDWWWSTQLWMIEGTSAHLVAVLHSLLRAAARRKADLRLVSGSMMMIPPLMIIMFNVIAISLWAARTYNSVIPQWKPLLGGFIFSCWVLAHLYPFVLNYWAPRGRTPGAVFLWALLIASTISLLWNALQTRPYWPGFT